MALIALISANAVSADSSTIYVNDSSGNDNWDGQYAEWQAGTLFGPKKSIKNATGTVNENGTIYIANGNYIGENNTNITINKNMALIGQSTEDTIINGTDLAQIFIIENGTNVTIQNLTICNGTAGDNETYGYGGAINNNGACTVENVIFYGNLADFGGAIYNEGNLTINDSIFMENMGYYGGAIANDGNLTINRGDFIGNFAIFYTEDPEVEDYSCGGAIFNKGNLTVINGNFSENVADFGGAFANIGNLTVTDGNFTDNYANWVAGAIYTTGGTLTNPVIISNSNFTGNFASFYGGSIVNEGNLTITSITFTGNSGYLGGAIANIGNLTVTSSTFTNNSASSSDYNDPYYGGAIWNSGNLTVNNGAFTGNIADYGGAISNEGALTINDSNFTENNAIFMGGAISNYGYSIVNNSNFIENYATSSVAGAIYNLGNLTINGSNFTNNTAYGGGAIYNEDSLNVNSSNFTNNTATYDNGGAISNIGALNVSSSTFTSNTATGTQWSNGGAINNGANLSVNNTTFNNNAAGFAGGAIWNGGNYNWTIIYSVFNGNHANAAGGAIYNRENGNLTVKNSIFNSNNADSNGGAIWNDATLNINSAAFNNNAAGVGSAIYTLAPLNVNFCQIVGNTPYDIYNPLNYYNEHEPINAEYNWWGTNDYPSGRVYGTTIVKWLVLNLNANPSLIAKDGVSNIMADLRYDSSGSYHNPINGHVPDGIPVNFETTMGTINDSTIVNGIAQSTLNAGAIPGIATVSAAVDSEIVDTTITIDGLSPNVSNIDPVDNAMNISPNKVITVTFSEPIHAGSTYNSISVTGASGIVPIIKNINGNILTIIPDLNYTDGLYTLSIPVNTITDLAGNNLAAEFDSNFNVDTAPTVNATPTGGFFNTSQTVLLSANDVQDPNPVIYYTIDGTTWNQFIGSGTVLTSDIGSTILEFYAIDSAGNPSAHITYNYTIDRKAPTAWVNVKGGLYSTNKAITLSMSEPGNIYYTLNGATPTTASTKYTGPITISSTTTLKWIAVDLAGNPSPVYAQKYNIDKTPPRVVYTSPRNYSIRVSRSGTIIIKFNENIRAGAYWSRIVLKNRYGRAISVNKWISGNTLYIKPRYRMSSYSYYSVYIPFRAIKDYVGWNAGAYGFRFKTGRY